MKDLLCPRLFFFYQLEKSWQTADGRIHPVILIHSDDVWPKLMGHGKATSTWIKFFTFQLDRLKINRCTLGCVWAPIGFEDILLSSHVASNELFERVVTVVRRNGIAIQGLLLFLSILSFFVSIHRFLFIQFLILLQRLC